MQAVTLGAANDCASTPGQVAAAWQLPNQRARVAIDEATRDDGFDARRMIVSARRPRPAMVPRSHHHRDKLLQLHMTAVACPAAYHPA